MGKRYHCDYCNKTMSASPSIIKTHNKGLVHQKLVLEHYQLYKDPDLILEEESKKKPCSRYPHGQCQFGRMCRFSHYTLEELNQLKEIVNQRKLTNVDTTPPSFEDLYQRLQDEKSKVTVQASISSPQDENKTVEYLERIAQYLTKYDSEEDDEKNYRIIVSNDLDENYGFNKSRNAITLDVNYENKNFFTLTELLTHGLNEKEIANARRYQGAEGGRKKYRHTGNSTEHDGGKNHKGPSHLTMSAEDKKKIDELKTKRQACRNANINKIINFLKDRLLSTNFIYEEIVRIKKTGIIRDLLRRYVYYLEHMHPVFNHEESVRNFVYRCYRNSLRKIRENMDLWSPQPNNLIIDIFNDYMKF